MKRALLVVDVQNDFLPGGALAVPEGDQIVPLINELMPLFDLVIATKDWHPLHHKSFALEHGKEPGEEIELPWGVQHLWPIHCVQESYGAEFAPQLNRGPIQRIFYKGTEEEIDSYSAFYDNAHQKSTGALEYLLERGVEELFIVGLATDYCVHYTALDALKKGLQVSVVIDACRGIHPTTVAQALLEMKAKGAKIILRKDLIF